MVKKLPDSELEIMMLIWDADEPVSTLYLMEHLDSTHQWAKTTVLNFLMRLVERGFLEVKKHSRSNTYQPLVTRESYIVTEGRDFLARLCKGDIRLLLESLYQGKAIGLPDLEIVRKLANEKLETEADNTESNMDETVKSEAPCEKKVSAAHTPEVEKISNKKRKTTVSADETVDMPSLRPPMRKVTPGVGVKANHWGKR